MRYAVQSTGMTVGQIVTECSRLGGRNIVTASLSKQVFVDLEPAAAQLLSGVPGVAVKPVGTVKTGQWRVPPAPVTPAIYAASQSWLSSYFYNLRTAFDPPLLGEGWTTCLLDTGVRKTHQGLAGKVVYEANFSSSPTADDVFDHGTGTAFLLAGGRHVPGEEGGIAPGVSIMNIKVIGDDGVGTEESVVLGLEHAWSLRADAIEKGLDIRDPMFPNNINMSLGSPDTGDPSSPVRRAIDALITESPEWDVPIVAAAGNGGPDPGTILSPACDPRVVAVGAVTFVPWDVWLYSSRGPTPEGYTKPEVVFYGVGILTASAMSDSSFTIKSGTSFAAPLVLGGGILVAEAIYRRTGVIPMEASDYVNMMPYVCRKPSSAPAGKDNVYGYGMPMGDLALGVVSQPSSLMQMVGPLLGIGLMAGMMSSMAKGIATGIR